MFRILPKSTGLWRNTDFVKLWAGLTVSRFGSFMGALQYTAVVLLHASPFQMGLLAGLNVAPGVLAGLFVGAWVDRVRRRPLLIAANAGRALALLSVPIAFALGALRIEQLYVVGFINGMLTTFFDVALGAYLLSLVGRGQLIEANSKLTAGESVVEATAFSIGGWMVQLVNSMALVITDAVSYLVSALALAGIRTAEQGHGRRTRRRRMLTEVREGLTTIGSMPMLRAVTVSAAIEGMMYGIVGAVVLLFGVRELGFQPGFLGAIFAVGGVSSIFGAVLAPRITRRFGAGPAMVLGFLVFGLAVLFLPMAGGPLAVAAVFLVAHQLFGNGAATVYGINEVSLRQAVTPSNLLGRVNATVRFVGVTAFFAGSVLGGALGEFIGLRLTLGLGAALGILGALWLAWSPVRAVTGLPEPFREPSRIQRPSAQG